MKALVASDNQKIKYEILRLIDVLAKSDDAEINKIKDIGLGFMRDVISDIANAPVQSDSLLINLPPSEDFEKAPDIERLIGLAYFFSTFCDLCLDKNQVTFALKCFNGASRYLGRVSEHLRLEKKTTEEKSKVGREKANKRHESNHLDKQFIKEYYEKHRDNFKNKSIMAKEIVRLNLVSQDYRTIYNWILQFHKENEK
jgi:hypothetical protein